MTGQSIQQRITTIQRQHRVDEIVSATRDDGVIDAFLVCKCGQWVKDFDAHVAGVLVEALGLTLEVRPGTYPIELRWGGRPPMGEPAQKLIAQVQAQHRRILRMDDGWTVCDGARFGRCDFTVGHLVDHEAHVAAEVDKALGGLGLAWAAVLPDNSYFGAFHEVHEFSPGEARKQAEADVAECEDAALKTRWVSGWSEATDA